MRNRLVLWLVILAFASSGCAIQITMPSTTVGLISPPGGINAIVAATAAAAQTQTAAFIRPSPTSTSTATASPTPSQTPTPTPTFIFLLGRANTPAIYPTSIIYGTPIVYVSPIESLDGCDLLSQTPADGAHIAAKGAFTAAWRVENTGRRTWHTDEVEFAFYSGTRMYKKQVYDLSVDVPRSEYITLKVPMTAPKNSGTYRTTWSLRRSLDAYPNPETDHFCHVGVTIHVP